jgi:hypothetical protein
MSAVRWRRTDQRVWALAGPNLFEHEMLKKILAGGKGPLKTAMTLTFGNPLIDHGVSSAGARGTAIILLEMEGSDNENVVVITFDTSPTEELGSIRLKGEYNFRSGVGEFWVYRRVLTQREEEAWWHAHDRATIDSQPPPTEWPEVP